ncbi:hypothetical protein PV08_05604 [Exophiala spinifera]|uniref:Uncharacterized protein n=1 Tax=Exophiala spinifera TaxID=91928 RepID=A0A0D1YKP6_9EURO|nr:uncharacterized protein PV08_05604 [Exophiala spinifera]KIW15556.1 hypothetical protein PV08_05604 [Exophiala spinifera]
MANEVILYDIPSKQGTSWSLNPWKTRLYLNYKNIPYKTEWTAYPDLEPKFEKFGIPPNETGTKYTAPTVKMPDGSYVVDSRRIAEGLDRIYPDPPLHIESKYQAPVEAALGNIMRCIRSVYMPLVPKMFLNPRCRDYFVATREKVVGMPLDEFGKTADHDVKSAEPYVRELSALLTETDGPFFEGKAPCYADFVVVAWVKMLKGLGVEEKIYALEGGEQLKKQYEAAQASGWFDRDSY